jgi:hypothetical protein
MPILLHLPFEIYNIIKDYLLIHGSNQQEYHENIQDWRNFCHCSRQVLEIKRLFCYFNLNSTHSHDYFDHVNLTIDDRRSPAKTLVDVSIILSTVANPSLQISLNLSYQTNLTDISCLKNIKILNLKNTKIRDVECLKDCWELDLSSTLVADVSSLGKVRYLNLSYCGNITDVSSLDQVLELNLAYCERVRDVSMLGGVSRLTLSDGMVTTDVYNNNLKCVKFLFVLDVFPERLPLDNNINALSCHFSIITPLRHFSHKNKTVYIDGNGNDIQPLKDFSTVYFRWNTTLDKIFLLGNIEKLVVYYCDSMKFIGEMLFLKELVLDDITPRSDLNALNLIDYDTLPSLKSLTLRKVCYRQFKIAGTVEKVEIIDCQKLKDLYLHCHLKSFKIKKPSLLTIHLASYHDASIINTFSCPENVSILRLR